MPKFMTGTDLMSELAVSRDTLALFAACGILSPTPVGTAFVYEPEEIARLVAARRAPVSEDAPPAWVVRLSAPSVDANRRAVGWREARSMSEKQDAARMYWRIARPEEAVSTALVAVVGPLVVGVWNIQQGIRHPDMKRSEFILSEPTAEQHEAYFGAPPLAGRWLVLRPGPTVLRWPPCSK